MSGSSSAMVVAAPQPLGEEGLRISFEWLPWGVDCIDAEVVHHPPEGLMVSLLFLPLFGLVGRDRLRQFLLIALALMVLAFLLVSCDLINIRVRSGDQGLEGEGARVAMLDTGIDPDHSDLAANYKGGYDFVNNDVNNDPLP